MNFSLKSVASLLFFTLFSAPFASCHADYNKNVIKLSGATFNEQVLKHEVMVYVTGCNCNCNCDCVETCDGQVLRSLLRPLP